MKNGKMILGAAALVVTAANVVAFKAHSKFSGKHQVYGFTSTARVCCTLSTAQTNATNPLHNAVIHTVVNNSVVLLKGVNNTLYTQITSSTSCPKTGQGKCKVGSSTVKWTGTH